MARLTPAPLTLARFVPVFLPALKYSCQAGRWPLPVVCFTLAPPCRRGVGGAARRSAAVPAVPVQRHAGHAGRAAAVRPGAGLLPGRDGAAAASQGAGAAGRPGLPVRAAWKGALRDWHMAIWLACGAHLRMATVCCEPRLHGRANGALVGWRLRVCRLRPTLDGAPHGSPHCCWWTAPRSTRTPTRRGATTARAGRCSTCGGCAWQPCTGRTILQGGAHMCTFPWAHVGDTPGVGKRAR